MTKTTSELRDAASKFTDPDNWQVIERYIQDNKNGEYSASGFYDEIRERLPSETAEYFVDKNRDAAEALNDYIARVLTQAMLTKSNSESYTRQDISIPDLYASIMTDAFEIKDEKEQIIKSTKIDEAVQKHIQTYEVEKHMTMDKLQALIESASESEYSAIALGTDYILIRGFATAHKTQDADRFNCDIWVKEGGEGIRIWKPADHTVLTEIEKLKKIDGFRPTARLASDVAKQLSGNENTLEVTYDAQYQRELNKIVIDQYGYYYDIETGKIREIEPSRQYYANPDTIMRLSDDIDTQAIQDFEAFLQERFGQDNWQIVRDHLAGIFLSGSTLGSKAKLLEIVGARNTWKSFLVEYVASMMHETAVSNVSMKQMGTDKVFGPATVINRRLNYSEETAPELPENQSTLKDLITREGGSARRMRSTQPVHAYRWPRWIVCANKMQPLGENDDDMSMLIRMIIVETLPNPDGQRDWRIILNESKVKESVMMYLLKRATEIHNNPDTMHTQDPDDTMREHERLRKDDLSKFIENNFERLPDDDDQDIGVSFTKFWHKFKNEMKVNITRPELKNQLESMDLTISGRVWCEPILDRSQHTYQHGTDTTVCKQRVLILGLKSNIRSTL